MKENNKILRSNYLVIDNLTRNVKNEHIHEIFTNFGKIKNIFANNLHRTFHNCLIQYENPDDIDSACQCMNGGQIDGKVVKAEIVAYSVKDLENFKLSNHEQKLSNKHDYYSNHAGSHSNYSYSKNNNHIKYNTYHHRKDYYNNNNRNKPQYQVQERYHANKNHLNKNRSRSKSDRKRKAHSKSKSRDSSKSNKKIYNN